MFSLRIIIPAFNEAARIEPTLVDYCTHFSSTAIVTVVANGCTDQTVAVVARLQRRFANLECVEVPFAIGKGGAVRVGLKFGDEDIIGYSDADGSTPAHSFADLVTRLRDQGVDGAIGSRWLPESQINLAQPTFRRAASRAFNRLVRLMFGLSFVDTQCGAKVFRREAIAPLLFELELSNFAFDVDILYGLRKTHQSVIEVPISWQNHRSGSKVRVFATALQMFVGLLRLRLRTGFFRRVPFVDRIARTSVIPCKSAFSAIVVTSRRLPQLRSNEEIERWVESAVVAGHEVIRVCIGQSMLQDMRIALWYFTQANTIYDVIIAANPCLPQWFRLISTKTIIGPEILLQNDVRTIFAELSSLTGYSTFFQHDENRRWHITGGRPSSRIALGLSMTPQVRTVAHD